MNTIDELFKRTGGTLNIAALLGINQLTVQRWAFYGIPQKHWEKLCKKYDLTPGELYTISQGAAKNKK